MASKQTLVFALRLAGMIRTHYPVLPAPYAGPLDSVSCTAIQILFMIRKKVQLTTAIQVYGI
jgi:hypothetical protein